MRHENIESRITIALLTERRFSYYGIRSLSAIFLNYAAVDDRK